MKLLTVLALAALLVLPAGCGGGESDASGSTQPVGTVEQPPDAPEAQEVVEQFVEAAGAGNTQAMFGLLSEHTRIRFGPTAEAFAQGSGKELAVVLGTFDRRGDWEVVLAAQPTPEFAVVTIEGYVDVEDDKEWGAYAAPVRKEGGAWRLELGGTASFNPLTPEPELESRPQPEISAEVTASEPILEYLVWVDDRAIPATLSADELIISATSPELEEGRHTITVFAQTQSSAGANAWTFVVG